MSFDLHRARTFAEVVRLGSVARAADALGYTQSAVSQQLSTLERDIGLTLVDRARRPLRPTPAGAELLPEVDALLARAGALGAAVDDVHGLRRGHVSLTAFASATATFVPPVVAAFRAAHPEVQVAVAQAETEPALAALRAGATDVAVVHLMPDQHIDTDGLVAATLGEDALHAVLAPTHPLAEEEAIALPDLAATGLIVPRAGPFRALVERLLDRAGAPLNVTYEVDDPRGAQAFAAAGLGAALMHGLILQPASPGVTVRPLTTADGDRSVQALYARGRRVPAARAMFELLAAGRGASQPRGWTVHDTGPSVPRA